MIQRVLREAAARGDIRGMMHLMDRSLCNQSDKDICTVTGAAGHLEALKWLRDEKHWPWDPAEVMRETSENLHVEIMTYVEQNSAGHEIQTRSYGVDLPWRTRIKYSMTSDETLYSSLSKECSLIQTTLMYRIRPHTHFNGMLAR